MKKPKQKRSTGNPGRHNSAQHKAKAGARARPEAPSFKLRPSAYSGPSRKLPAAAAAIATRYSSDDRATLGLLLAPFVIVAISLGMQQSLKVLPARETGAITANSTRPEARLPVAAANPAATTVAMAPVTPAATAPVSASPLALPVPLEGERATSRARRAPAPEAQRTAALAPSPPPAITTPAPLPALPSRSDAINAPLPKLALLPLPAPAPAPVVPEAKPAPIATAPIAPAPIAPPRAEAGGEPEVCLAPATLPGGVPVYSTPPTDLGSDPRRFGLALAVAARGQANDFVIYNARYASIRYPMGDVAQMYGVCTDVVVRAYRALGFDLQELIQTTKTGRGDRHIDHRRVDTVRRFLERHGDTLPKSQFAEDYAPGDIVTYYRPQNRSSTTHIAIVTDIIAPSGRPMIVHNRGWGPQLEDALFVDQITGHFRFSGELRRKGEPATDIARGKFGAPPAGLRARFAMIQAFVPMSRMAPARETTVVAAATGASTAELRDDRRICRPGASAIASRAQDPQKFDKKPQRTARFATASARNSSTR